MMRGNGVTCSPSIKAYVTELHVGKQHGTGMKSLTWNLPEVCDSISLKRSGMVIRVSGSCSKWRPA